MKRELIFSLAAVLAGVLAGLISKACDSTSFIGDLTTEIGVWVFLASVLAANCTNPISAGVNTSLFFLGMLSGYYAYTHFVLGFFSSSYIMMWLIASLLAAPCAALLWFAKGRSKASVFIAALPVAYLLFHGYPVWYTHNPVLLMDIIFAALLIIILPTGAKRRGAVLAVSFPMAFICHFIINS
jgi:hypothetical protein